MPEPQPPKQHHALGRIFGPARWYCLNVDGTAPAQLVDQCPHEGTETYLVTASHRQQCTGCGGRWSTHDCYLEVGPLRDAWLAYQLGCLAQHVHHYLICRECKQESAFPAVALGSLKPAS